jgi:hypothetical protein
LAAVVGSHDGALTKNDRKRTKPHKAGVLAPHLASGHGQRYMGVGALVGVSQPERGRFMSLAAVNAPERKPVSVGGWL